MLFDFKLKYLCAHHKHQDMNPWVSYKKGILKQESRNISISWSFQYDNTLFFLMSHQVYDNCNIF